jgi:hypothetical protein
MKKAATEKNIVVVLFIAVLVFFSMAERDTRKLTPLYSAFAKGGAQKNLAKTYQVIHQKKQGF